MGLQLCFSEGGDSYDWNPIMQTILILSCLLAAASSLYLHHPLLLLPSSGYGLNQAHPGGGSSYQHISRLHKREAEADADAEAEAEADPLGYYGLPLAYHTGYPSWPGVRGLGFSSTCYGCRGKRSAELPIFGKRSAEPVYGLPLLRAYHHAPLPLPFLHHLVPTATGEVNESGLGYEVKQTHGLHASSFQSVTRGEVAEPAAAEEEA